MATEVRKADYTHELKALLADVQGLRKQVQANSRRSSPDSQTMQEMESFRASAEKAALAANTTITSLKSVVTELRAEKSTLKTKVKSLEAELETSLQEKTKTATLNSGLTEQIKSVNSIFSMRSLVTIATTSLVSFAIAALIF